MRCVALLLLVSLAFHGCSGESPRDDEDGPLRVEATGPLRLTDVSALTNLDIVQVSGSETVDHIIDSIGAGAAWLDYDADGDADLYLAQGATRLSPEGPPDRLLRNDGDADGDGVPRFTDVAHEAGLGDRRWSFGVSAADVDNDGDTDLYIANWGANRLYLNNGDGTFTDVAREAGVEETRWSTSSTWSDVDRDGDLDLYVTNYVVFDFERYPGRGRPLAGGAPPCVWRGLETFCGPRNLEPAPDAFYRNEGDADGDGVPRFVESTAAAGLLSYAGHFALDAHFFDADNDGDDDLYVANDSVQNTYYVNNGDGTFDEQAILSGLAYNEQGMEQAGMGISSADFNGDGRLDLAVTNFSHDHDTIYRNDGDGMFTDVSYPSGVGTASFLSLAWGVRFADLDQDGLEDLFVAHGHVYPQVDEGGIGTSFRLPNGLYRNRGDGTFDDVAAGAGSGLALVRSSRALLATDLDDDGDLDFLVTNLNAAPDLLRNDSPGGNSLAVRLIGTRSNRDGIGARIVVSAGNRTQIREMRTHTPYGATLPVVHFGLGEATRLERLEVRWPSGSVTALVDIEPRGRIELQEGPSGEGPAGR
ncbi:MAG: CRTAC1 family protein [bacterium]|nr:CRTAC1 family protein [bacterium]